MINTDPEFPFTEELSLDGLTLNVYFLDDYVMPYDTRFTIEFVGRSGCMPLHGITADCQVVPVRYAFKTMAREER